MTLTVSELLAAFRGGHVKPREFVEQTYERIARHGQRPVWVSLVPLQTTLEALRAAQARNPHAPLLGVPFAVKDNIDVAGQPTTAGCPQFAYTPLKNATVVQHLLDAGALVIGKTNLDQFATGLVGTRSPYGTCTSVANPRYISGGSSSGSAVAVARGDVSFALGTDTAGSGRVPAAFNDLVGLKPTRGLLSTAGVVPACRSLDCVSLFTRSLDDAELIFKQCVGFDSAEPFSRDAQSLPASRETQGRIGVPHERWLEFFDDAASQTEYAHTIARLKSFGWQVVEFDFAPFKQASALLYHGPWIAERQLAFGEFIKRNPQAVDPTVREIMSRAPTYTAEQAFAALYELTKLKRQIEPLWRQVDAIVLPTVPTHYTVDEVNAEPILLNTRLGTYTNFANLLDLCAIAVPAGSKPSGLPFSVTWYGPAGHDLKLMECIRVRRAPVESLASVQHVVKLAVVGAHLSGQPLNHQLSSRGARLLGCTRTAPEYQLFALATQPPKPGLVHAQDHGSSIEVEIWELPVTGFGEFVAEVPAPMTIGMTKLLDGSWVKGFGCEPRALTGALDITHHGGWRQYLATQESPRQTKLASAAIPLK